jgi:ABC-type Na+ efflux pump permease subunit
VIDVGKIAAVAETEVRTLVRSKSFLVSLAILPVLMIGASFAQKQLSGRADRSPRRFAIVDGSGRLGRVLVEAAERRNAALSGDKTPRAPFLPELVDGGATDASRLRLSDRVRKEELFAFVEIPADLDHERVRYYSDHPAYDELREFIVRTLDEALRAERVAAAHLPPELVEALGRKVAADSLGLATRDTEGRVHAAEKQDVVRALVVPMVPMFLLFFFVVVSMPQLMNSVLTEKVTRISEVLLGSLSPTELMAGKLIGSSVVALLLGVVYVAGGITVAARMGVASAVAPSQVAWFLVFLLLATLLYGAGAMAVGAACNDVKEAQNLMLPLMLPFMVPMMIAPAIVESPSSAMAVGLSLFPPATPLVMLLRIGAHPAAPLWQVGLGAVGALIATALGVWAAGRVFRVGLLLTGKSASIGQMVRWIFR